MGMLFGGGMGGSPTQYTGYNTYPGYTRAPQYPTQPAPLPKPAQATVAPDVSGGQGTGYAGTMPSTQPVGKVTDMAGLQSGGMTAGT